MKNSAYRTNHSVQVRVCFSVFLHLLHGAEAAHRNLGMLTPANGPSIRWGGRLLASGIGGGFLLISLGLALGGLA